MVDVCTRGLKGKHQVNVESDSINCTLRLNLTPVKLESLTVKCRDASVLGRLYVYLHIAQPNVVN